MRVLILGGTGMLGHKLWQVFSSHFETYVTLRRSWASCPRPSLFDPERTLEEVTADNFDSVADALARCRPDVVVNAVGIVKQHRQAQDPLTSIAVNAHFPHRLARLCQAAGRRLIHVSTDCVFSGERGNYAEDQVPDPIDLYGRTKLLGEVNQPGCLTIRTSIIGRELESAHGLIEWLFKQQGGSVPGYTRAIFSGLTTRALAEMLMAVIKDHPRLDGIWHIASQPVSKYDLLSLVQAICNLRVTIRPDDSVCCDRSLNGGRFRRKTGLETPPWPHMLETMSS